MKSLQNKRLTHKPEQVVLTGYRMLKILKLLIAKPHSTEEINSVFKSDPYINKSVSNDMICLYINTLRHIGCDITRPSKSNNFKYTLITHPFELKITKKHSQTLAIILESLMHSDNWEFVIEVCNSFEELKNLTAKNSDLNFLRTISNILKINSDLIHKLNSYCKKNKSLSLEYSSTSTGKKIISIIADKLFLENTHLYLWGYNEELEEMQYLRVDRIKDIKVISLKNSKIEQKRTLKVQYKLFNQTDFKAGEKQKILEENNNYILIEESVDNKFKFTQKILTYANDCTILKPNNIRKEIIQTLKEVLEQYD